MTHVEVVKVVAGNAEGGPRILHSNLQVFVKDEKVL